jgi:hypothetical protein
VDGHWARAASLTARAGLTPVPSVLERMFERQTTR